MQTIIVLIIIACAVGYATLRIYKTIKQHNSPCYGCKGCELREQIRKNQAAKRQKQDKPDCFNKK
jgi:hypothetical protein